MDEAICFACDEACGCFAMPPNKWIFLANQRIVITIPNAQCWRLEITAERAIRVASKKCKCKMSRREFIEHSAFGVMGIAVGTQILALNDKTQGGISMEKQEQEGNRTTGKLVAYEYVPSGFEMVLGDGGNEMVPGSSGGCWNLWFNVTLTDDPESWDNEIKAINQMQDRLGEITLDQRLIRALIAAFCGEHPPSPQSIDVLCKEIGDGHFSTLIGTGCEGRGLLEFLGYTCSLDDSDEYTQSLKKWLEPLGYHASNGQMENVRAAYARSLRKWLARGQPESPIELKVFGFLGQPTDSKEVFVEKFVSMIDSEDTSIPSLRKVCEEACRKTCATFDPNRWVGRPLDCFPCKGSGSCCYFLTLQAGLLCVGTSGEERSILDEFRRFTEENVLAYSLAINSWLEEAAPKHITSLGATRYIAKDSALEIAERTHSSLGEKDKAKEWLAACFLKTIKDNRGWRAKLLDDFPEATSWLRGKHGARP